jgi:hypothetical protein
MLPTKQRIEEVYRLARKGQYFTIHSSRQSGKTTCIKDLVNSINEEEHFYAVYCSLETSQNIKEYDRGILSILKALEASFYDDLNLSTYTFIEDSETIKSDMSIRLSLTNFVNKLDKPLIILFDEADCLEYDILISFMRQLRSGYINRDMRPFVHSIGLVGMRRLKDYKLDVRPENQSTGTVSPFNIVAGHYTLENFTLEEVKSLYLQHTEATGQIFEDRTIEKAHYYSGGHPWLVNAIARECVEIIHKEDYKKNISLEDIESAVQTLIIRRDTHFDSLMERLKEDRVKKIVEPMIIGGFDNYEREDDDFQYVIDLGILSNNKGGIAPANPMYKEIIIRTLSGTAQQKLPENYINKWLDSNSIDMNLLLKEFQNFWRENSEIWTEWIKYKEAAPHLILQAFLQRVINGGGKIHREYATGRKRLDLCVEFHQNKYPIELKLLYNDKTIPDGISQLSNYMDTMGTNEGWLIVFDRTSDKTWDEKIFWETKQVDNKKIHILGA